MGGVGGEYDRQIRQSSPLVGAVNNITVVLQGTSSAHLSGSTSTVLTLSNLQNLDRHNDGTSTSQGWVLPLHEVDGGNGGHSLFCVRQVNLNGSALVLDNRRLQLSLCLDAVMQPMAIYSFSFKIRNPDEEQEAGAVYVAATGSSPSAHIGATLLSNSLAPAQGMLAGALPFRVRVARITSRTLGQSTPVVGKVNELTMTFATNVQLEQNAGWTIRIAGLTGTANVSGPLLLSPLPPGGSVTGLFCQGGVPDRGMWSGSDGSGMLVLQLCLNKVLAADYDHVFSFQVLNGQTPQQAPNISVSVTGHASITMAPLPIVSVNAAGGLTGNATPIRGIPRGSAPLFLIKPRFELADVSQSNPVTSAPNILTVSLQSNIDVLPADGVVITISNLVGASGASPMDLARYSGGNGAELLFCEALTVSSGKFVADILQVAHIELTLCPGAHLHAQTVYVFSVSVTNPSQEQQPPLIMVSATGWLMFAMQETTAPLTSARGLSGGSVPLTIVVPEFEVRAAGQTNPAAGLPNIISLTLSPNVDIYAAQSSAITFTGLPSNPHYPAQQATQITLLGGDDPADTTDGRNRVQGLLSPLPAPAITVNAGSWDAQAGTLNFYIAKGKQLSGGLTYVISFQIKNRDSPVNTPDLLVEASADSSFVAAMMKQPYLPAAGVPNGANAFYVTCPEFVTRSIWQATPVVGEHNTIVMTLSPNFNLEGPTSIIFIAGLLGSGLGVQVEVHSSLPLFCFNGDISQAGYAAFDQSSATLAMQLCPAALFSVGDEAVVSFNLTNPNARQESPAIIIRATGIYLFLNSAMLKSGADWQLIAGGHDALMVVAILEWTGANVTKAPSKGGAKINLQGQPFPSSFGVATLPFNCSFDFNGNTTLTETAIKDGVVLICLSPQSSQQQVMNFQLQYNGQQLNLGVPTALTHDDQLFPMRNPLPNPFQLLEGWEAVAPVSPLQGAADGSTLISIAGYGFNWQKGYKCHFFHAGRFEETGAAIRSQTFLTCRTPVWGLRYAATTTAIKIIRIDGPAQESVIPFTNGTVDEADAGLCLLFPQYGRCTFTFHNVWSITGETRTFVLPPSQPTVFSAAGGEEMYVSGMGLDAQVDYVCRFVFRYGPFEHAFVSPYPARFVNHTLIVCTTPVWKYYYTEKAELELLIVGQDTPVALATLEQSTAITFKEVYYALEPSAGSAAGGYRVTVRGFGFDQGKRYRIRKNGFDVGLTRVDSLSEISFTMPSHVGAQRMLNLTLQYDDINPICQGELVRLIPDSHPLPDNTSRTGIHGDCATYAYGRSNWNHCVNHSACPVCATTCATECGLFDGEEAQHLAFSLDAQWVSVDTTVLDPSITALVTVEAYGVGAPHKYFSAYPDAPLLECTLSQGEPYMICPTPLAAYDSKKLNAELRIYEGADASSAVSIQSPFNPHITLVHVNRPPVFRIPFSWIDTVFENDGDYDQILVTNISRGNRDSIEDPREAQQLMTFKVSYAPVSLFDVPPRVSVDGRLTMRIKANRNGLARIWVTLHDDGGTSNNGADKSEMQVVYLLVRSQVQEPELMLAPNPLQISEGFGGRIMRGFMNISLHLDTHALQSVDIELLPVSPEDLEYFEQNPTLLHNGDLLFELKEYAFGTANFLMLFHGIDGASSTSVLVTKNLTIEIAPVNQAPSFSFAHMTVAVIESRAWEHGILELNDVLLNILPRQDVPQHSSPRGEDWAECTQTVTFLVSVGGRDSGIVRVDQEDMAPRVDMHGAYPLLNGTVRLVTRPNSNGLLLLNITAVDSANSSSVVQQLHVHVLAVNDAPRIDADCNISHRILCIQACPRYPYNVPAAGLSRSLLALGASQSGPEGCVNASSQVRVQVDENCENCPDDSENVDGFDVSPCNGRRFSLAGLFASSPSIWDSEDELGQNVTFVVTQTDTYVDADSGYVSLFSVAPEVRQKDGRLSFCLNEDANGNATLQIVAMDDGGDERGGVFRSHATVLVIDIVPVNQAPLFSLVKQAPLFTLLLSMWAGSGNQTVAAFASAISKGNTADDFSDREASQHATFHVTLDENAAALFESDVVIDEQGTLRVDLAHYQVGTTHSQVTLLDDGGVYGAGRNSSAEVPVLIAVVDSVLLLKISKKHTDMYDPLDEMLLDAAQMVSSILSLGQDWIEVRVISEDERVQDLVCGLCPNGMNASGGHHTVDACRNRDTSTVVSSHSPWAGESAKSFYARVLLPDLNYTWAERIEQAVVPAQWKVSWVQHLLHTNCANKPSFHVGGLALHRDDAVVNKSLVDYNMTVLFDEIESITSALSLRGFLSAVVAPQDVAIDAIGQEQVLFDVEPVAHKLFGRLHWSFDGTDGGLMQTATQVVATYNSTLPPRWRERGECHEAELLVYPKPFWNGRVLYRVSMRGSHQMASFEIEVVPINQIPTFNKIEEAVYVNEDVGNVLLPNMTLLVAAGPDVEDENRQILAFDLHLIEGASDIVNLQSIHLEIANGVAALHFETLSNRNGILTFNASLRDQDVVRNDSKSSSPVTFRLVVRAVNDEPVLAINCSSDTLYSSSSSLYSMSPAGLFNESSRWWENEQLLSCSNGVEASQGCRNFGSLSCAMLIHVDENCDDCVGRQETGGSCFVLHHLVLSRPSLEFVSDEANQSLSFIFDFVSGVDMLLSPFEVSRQDDSLTFCLSEDMNGVATYRVTAVDDAGQALFGRNVSEMIILQLDVHPVNQAPSFLVCCDSMVTLWTGGVQLLEDFAYGILNGRANADGSDREYFQHSTFHVVAGMGTHHLFAALPVVSANGTLTTSLVTAVPGVSHFSVYLVDDAGTYGLGRNTSQTHNVSLSVVDSYVAFRISLDRKGMLLEQDQMQMYARDAIEHVLGVPHTHWVTMCGNHSLFNHTICQAESARAALAPSVDTAWPNSLNTLALRTIYVLARSGQEAVAYSLKVQEIGQVLRNKISRTLRVEALPIRRNYQQHPHYDVDPLTLEQILEVDLQKWSPMGSDALIVRNGFLKNVLAPQHVPYNLDAHEHLLFEIRPLGHRLFGRENWTLDGTDGGLMVWPPNVTADCVPLCHEATLTLAPKEFWNGEVMYQVMMLTTDIKVNFTIFVQPVNQVPRLAVLEQVYLLHDEFNVVNPAALNIIPGPHVEDERAQLMHAMVLDPLTVQTLGAAQVIGNRVAINVSLLEHSLLGNTSLQLVVIDSGTYLGINDSATSLPMKLNVQAIRINSTSTIEQNSDCSTSNGCEHPDFASDLMGLKANQQQITYAISKISGESVREILISPDGTLTVYSVFDRIGMSYFRVTLTANGSIPVSFVDRVTAINVSYVNQPPRFTLLANGSAFLVNEQEPVLLPDDADFDAGYGGCDTYSSSYISTEEVPSNLGFCVHDDACRECAGACAEECRVLGGLPTLTLAAREILSGSPIISMEVAQQVTFSLVRLNASAQVLDTCGFAFPSDIREQDGMQSNSPLLQGEPYMFANGTLRFHLTPYRFGVVPFNVTLKDEFNLSTTKLMCFAVMPVNQPPTFSLRDNVVHVAESYDGGIVSCDACVGIAYHISAGPLEAHQTLSFVVTLLEARIPSYVAWAAASAAQVFGSGSQGEEQLFETGSSVSIDSQNGTLSFRLKSKRYGKVRFAVTLHDSGGVERGGMHDSIVHVLVLDVMPVNDAPTFDLIAKQFDFVERSIEHPLSHIEIGSNVILGPWQESSQTPTFSIEQVAGPEGVILKPVASLGSGFRVLLDMTIVHDRFGEVNFTVTILDDGGVDRGGVDRTTYNLVIAVAAVNNPPSLLLVSNQLLVNRNSGCSGLGIYGGNRTLETGDGTVKCASAWDNEGSAAARLQDLGAGKCDRAGEPLLHEHLGFVARFSLGAFEDGANGCPTLANHVQCCSSMCVNTSAPDFASYPACGCEKQVGFFNLTVLDPQKESELFDEVPRILYPCGVLYFKLNLDVSGRVHYSLVLQDGFALSTPSLFSIAVLKSNIEPHFIWSMDPVIEVLEDSGAYSQQIATNVSVDTRNGAIEPEQFATFMFVPAYSNLFASSAQPRIEIFKSAGTSKGRLLFTPAPDAFGMQHFTVAIVDDGGVERGGINTFERNLTLVVISVNDAPYFVIPPYLEILESSGVNQLPGFASQVSPGAANEASAQHVTFSVDFVSSPELFSRAPAISPEGTLTLIPEAYASGYAVVTVRLIDDDQNCGTEGHTCASTSHTFTVSIKAENNAPGFATPWGVTCDTTTFLDGGVCKCPVVATVEERATAPAACLLHNMTSIGLPYLCPTPSNPEKDCAFIGREGLSRKLGESKVVVLEDSGSHVVDGLVHGISSEAGRSASSSTRFYQTAWDPALEMTQEFRDDVLGQAGLEYAHAYAHSADGKFVYAVERELNSLALFEKTDEILSRDTSGIVGGRVLKIVDRLAEGQDRVRFVPSAGLSLSSEAVCGLTEVWIEGKQHVVAASGCQLLQDYAGNASNRSCISPACNSTCCNAVEHGLIGHWEMSVDHMYGRHRINALSPGSAAQTMDFSNDMYWQYKRNKISMNSLGVACTEEKATELGPSTVRDLRDTLGAAIFRGAGLFCKNSANKLDDWDKPPAAALSAANFIMNNGALEAMQFDGRLNLGLLVAEDSNAYPVNSSMPADAFSVDIWFMLDTDAGSPSVNRGLIAAFVPGSVILSSQQVESECTAGWRLSYKAQLKGSTNVLSTVLTFELVAHNKTDESNPNITYAEPVAKLKTNSPALSLRAGEWHHVLAVSDMHQLSIYLDGKLVEGASDVTCPTCQGPVYQRESASCAMIKTPVTIGTFCQTGDCAMDSPAWSPHIGGIFSARVWNRAVTAGEATRLHAMHATRLTPFDPLYYWVGGKEQPLLTGLASSPSISTAPVSVTGDSAKITIRGQFSAGKTYKLELRDSRKNESLIISAAPATAPATQLVFDLKGHMWMHSYSSASMSVLGPDLMPLWQRVCLKTQCGLAISGEQRVDGLSPGLQGSRMTFIFTTNSSGLIVTSTVTDTGITATFFTRQDRLFPTGAFLGAASSTRMRIDGVDYLAVANYWDGKFYQVQSRILRPRLSDQNDASRFEILQNISSNGAREFALVDVSQLDLAFSKMLVLANYLAPSVLMPWQANSAPPVDTAQSVTLGTSWGASAVKVFNVSGWPYIVLSVFADPTTANATLNVKVPSRIVRIGRKLNDTHSAFGLHVGTHDSNMSTLPGMGVGVLQEFDTSGAHDVEIFRTHGRLYLIFAINLPDQDSLLYVSPGGDSEPHFALLQHLAVGGHATSLHAFYVNSPPASFGPTVASVFRNADPVQLVLGRASGQGVLLRFNGTNLLAVPDGATLPLDWAGGQNIGSRDTQRHTQAVLALSVAAEEALNASVILLGEYKASYTQYAESQVLERTRVGVRGLEAPSSVVEIEVAGKIYLVVASVQQEGLTVFERNSSQAAEVLVYRGESGRCADVQQVPRRLDDYPQPQMVPAGWSGLTVGWSNMSRPCVFAISAARGAIAAMCFNEDAELECVDIMFDGQEVEADNRVVDGLAGAVALTISSDSSSIYVAGLYDQAVALLAWSQNDTFVFVDRIKQGERLIHTLHMEIDDTVPEQQDTPPGFFKVQLPLDLSKTMTVPIPAGYPQAGSMVSFRLEPTAQPGGMVYAPLLPPAPIKYPTRVGGNMRNWSLNARDTEHWTLHDGTRYMAIASSNPSWHPDGLALVAILVWDEVLKRFDVIQHLEMHEMAPSALASFEVKDMTGTNWRYLAVGSTLRHGDVDASINVYRWNPALMHFVFHHGAPATLAGGHPNHPLTGRPLPLKLNIQKIVHWEMDGNHYLAAAVSRVVFKVGFLDEQRSVSCEGRPGEDRCVTNVSLVCRVSNNDGSYVNVTHYDWQQKNLFHSTANCTRQDSAKVCQTETRIEDGKTSTGFRPHIVSTYPFDVASCVTGSDTRCNTNITGPSSLFGKCTHVNVTRCTDEEPYTVCVPHYKWFTETYTSQSAYVYRWNNYGSTVLEDGQVGHGSGLQIFQLLDAPRSMDVVFEVLEEEDDSSALHRLLILASFGETSADGNVIVMRFDRATYNPYMRSNVGRFSLMQQLPCSEPTALALHTITDSRLGLVGTLLGVASSSAPLATTAAQTKSLQQYTSTLLFYTWNATVDRFDPYVVSVVGDSLVPRGAMGLTFFEVSGEVYLAVAQGVCFAGQHDDSFDAAVCEHSTTNDTNSPHDVAAQPMSRVLQFNRVEQEFGEMLALTDASNMAVRGVNVADLEIHEHQQALRFACGRTNEWEVLVVDGRVLLLAASETRGVLIYEFDFDHVVGLAGISAIASNGTTWQNGRPLERIFVASGSDRAVLALLHDKWGHVHSSHNGSLHFRWDAVLSMSPLPVRRDLETRATAGEVLGLEAPRSIKLRCEVRQAKVAHRHYRDQDICYIDVTSIADRGELPCGTFAPIAAPTRFLLQHESLGPEFSVARNPVCQTLSFAVEQVSSTNSMLFEPGAAPAIAPNGTLTFRLRPLQYGISRHHVVSLDAGGRQSADKMVVIEVLTVNHAPFFTLTDIYGGQDNVLGVQQLVFAPMVSPGAPHETLQNLTWRFSYTNPNQFDMAPVLTTRHLGSNPSDLVGMITFTTKQSGAFESEFRVVLVDDGRTGTPDGSNNTSPMGVFKLTVLINNNPPNFISITGLSARAPYPVPEVIYDQDNTAVLPIVHTTEDQGPVSVQVAFNKGHAREQTQRVSFELVRVEAVHSLFSGDRLFQHFTPVIPLPSGIVVSPAELSFETTPGYNGRFMVTVAISDDGGKANFGKNRTEFSFELAVKARDSFPAYVLLHPVKAVETHVARQMVVDGVLGNFSAMPDDEIMRPLSFVILSNDAPWLFSQGPVFARDGSVTFTLVPARSGAALLTVALVNDLGTLDDRRSVSVAFHVAQINSPPTARVPHMLAIVEQQVHVDQNLTGALYDVLPGPYLDEWDSQKVSFVVSFVTSTMSLFVSEPYVDSSDTLAPPHEVGDMPKLPPHVLRFSASPYAHGVAELSLVPYDDGGVLLGGLDRGTTLITTLKIYPRPRVHSVHPRLGRVSGGSLLTVRGDFFGSAYSRGYLVGAGTKYGNVSVLIGGLECEHVLVQSDSELHCTAPTGRGCADVSVTILDGSLTRTGYLPCGFVYTEMLFGGVYQQGTGVLALGPRDAVPGGASLVFDLELSKSVLAMHMVRDASQVMVGGSFLSAGGVRVNHVALYDGHLVHKLGNGVDGSVHALVELPGGDMVAAGVFTKAFLSNGGSVRTGGLARWDGVRWSAVQCAVSGSLFSAAVNGSMLYVGGRIIETCGIPTRGIALWDSHRWRALGSGLAGGVVHAIALHHDFVYVGGSFVEAGGQPASRVARWDGADWHSLGALNGDVHSLAVFGEYVFAGGDFTKAGSQPCNYIARFYSGDWVQVGPGVNGPVLSLQPIHQCLYVGGSFSQVLNSSAGVGTYFPDTSRLVRWCLGDQGMPGEHVFEPVHGAGQKLGSIRAIAASPTQGLCSATIAVC